MASVFKPTRDIVQEMCDEYKAITGITLTPDQIDDSTVIKFWTDAGPLSAFYSTMQQVLNNFFTSTADLDSLLKKLTDRSMPGQIQAGKSHGQIALTLTGAASITAGQAQVKRASDGALFNCIQSGSLAAAGTLVLYFESVNAGNGMNLSEIGDPFTLVTAIPNVAAACTNSSQFLDGRDLETADEIRARIIEHDQDDNSGGNAVAYETWAKEASAEVVTAKCLRLVRGPDTVDVIITSGTSDISGAVESGQAVTRQPSSVLISIVQAYIANLNPVTDDVLVKAPTEVPFNTTFSFSLYTETPSNRSFVASEITKVWKTYVLSARPQDVLSPSDLERLVDKRVGDLIRERNCSNFAGATSKYVVPDNSILSLGTLTLQAI